MLPSIVLCRLDCILESTKSKVLEAAGKLPATLENRDLGALVAFSGELEGLTESKATTPPKSEEPRIGD